MTSEEQLFLDIDCFVLRFKESPAWRAVLVMLKSPAMSSKIIQFSGDPTNHPHHPRSPHMRELLERVKNAAAKEINLFDQNPRIVVERCELFIDLIDKANERSER